MLASVTYEVLFRVEVNCDPGEVVCITGDCPQLGAWDPHRVVQLYREGSREGSSDKRCTWARKVKFNGCTDMKYRYLTAQIFQPESEDEDNSIIVTKWETHIRPRVFSIAAAVTDAKDSSTETIDRFGCQGDQYRVSPGWLIDHSQITLHLHNNPFKFWSRKYRDTKISVKCTPIDHRYRDDHEDNGGNLPVCMKTIVTVSVLRQGESTPATQGPYGMVYLPDSHMMFSIQTLHPEHTGLQLDFYHHSAAPDGRVDGQCPGGKTTHEISTPRHVGYSFILPLGVHKSNGHKTATIFSVERKPLGEVTFDYLHVRPMIGIQCNLNVSYQHHWKRREALDIGHRGMGISHELGCKTLATIRENTIESLKSATSHGADYVELDVQLSKDKAVVVFHNFRVNIAYKKKSKGESEVLHIPVKDFTLAQLQHLKVVHPTDTSDEVPTESIDNDDDVQPFPTLQKCFQSVDIHTGFNIEIKYPQWLMDVHELEHYFDRNEVVDTILREVFKYHAGRRIIFSSFDCDICIALQKKQNRFPVLFLTQGDTTAYAMYRDKRTQSVEIAAEFCIANHLLGVNAMSELLLKDTTKIQYVQENGLVLFTWGEDNNDTETINKLKQLKVDAIIYDRIDHFKTSGKESIFKVEKNQKIQLLQTATRYSSITLDKASTQE